MTKVCPTKYFYNALLARGELPQAVKLNCGGCLLSLPLDLPWLPRIFIRPELGMIIPIHRFPAKEKATKGHFCKGILCWSLGFNQP